MRAPKNNLSFKDAELLTKLHGEVIIKHSVDLCFCLVHGSMGYSWTQADMAELADAQDLGSCIERCMGSSPTIRIGRHSLSTFIYL